MQKIPLPTGIDDFKKLRSNNNYYIDKTILIEQVVETRSEVTLFTRPRRFGKSLNMSMLQSFFEIGTDPSLFDNLYISKNTDLCEKYLGKYPVIFISLKGIDADSYEKARAQLIRTLNREARKFQFLLESDKLTTIDKKLFLELLDRNMEEDAITSSLQELTELLEIHYSQKVIVLIDEYDVPLAKAHENGYYDKMVLLIRNLFGNALKTNTSLAFAVLTGCLRIAKESIFTGLNNLAVNSILSNKYSESFGFVQYEVDELMKYYNIEEKSQLMKKWYDGYLFGKSEVYNPWSVLNQVKEWSEDKDISAIPWWTNTSSNNIIRTLVSQADNETKDIIENLIHGGSVETVLKETVTYGDLTENNENIWSFLFFTGYLKIKEIVKTGEVIGEPTIYSLVIPNLEIKSCYTDIIIQYFEIYKKAINKDNLYKALLGRNAQDFAEQITDLLRKTISYYDSTESFYNGLISGLLSGNVYYKVESNRETGDERSDLVLYQQDVAQNAVILEFKVCGKNETADDAAKRALKQINDRDYASKAREDGYKNIIKYGVAFKGKMCYAIVE